MQLVLRCTEKLRTMGTFAPKQPSKDASKRKPAVAKPAPVRQGRNFPSLSTGTVLLQRKPACACGGGCPRCQAERDLEEILPIQTKLKISQPGDKYEQEADRVAEQVMQMPESAVQCQTKQEEEELLKTQPLITPLMQTKTEEGKSAEVARTVAAQIQSLPGKGQSLPESTRAFFEARFGYDLSLVQVHKDKSADDAARLLNARAFTIGNHIIFETKHYAPETVKGRHLLAHELTHVLQQSKVSSLNSSLSFNTNDPMQNQTKKPLELSSDKISLNSTIGIQREIQYDEDCNEQHTGKIGAAIVEARDWRTCSIRALRGYLSYLKEQRRQERIEARRIRTRVYRPSELGQLIIEHFGGQNTSIRAIEDIIDHFMQVDLQNLLVSCSGRCPDNAGACAVAGSGIVRVVSSRLSWDMVSSYYATLMMHEAFHASFSDFNHDSYWGRPDYPGSSPLTNADSYARFANALCCRLSIPSMSGI